MAATTAVAATAGWPVDGMDPIDGRGRHPPQVKIIIVHSESAKQRRARGAGRHAWGDIARVYTPYPCPFTHQMPCAAETAGWGLLTARRCAIR